MLICRSLNDFSQLPQRCGYVAALYNQQTKMLQRRWCHKVKITTLNEGFSTLNSRFVKVYYERLMASSLQRSKCHVKFWAVEGMMWKTTFCLEKSTFWHQTLHGSYVMHWFSRSLVMCALYSILILTKNEK